MLFGARESFQINIQRVYISKWATRTSIIHSERESAVRSAPWIWGYKLYPFKRWIVPVIYDRIGGEFLRGFTGYFSLWIYVHSSDNLVKIKDYIYIYQKSGYLWLRIYTFVSDFWLVGKSNGDSSIITKNVVMFCSNLTLLSFFSIQCNVSTTFPNDLYISLISWRIIK